MKHPAISHPTLRSHLPGGTQIPQRKGGASPLELFTLVSVNLFSFIFLAIVLAVARVRLDRHNKFNKLFLLACLLVLAALVLETVVTILDGRPYLCTACVLRVLYIFLYTLPPVLSYFWMLSMKVLTGSEETAKSILRPPYLIPAAVNLVLSVLSGLFGLLFTIDGHNVYARGPLFFVMFAIVECYLAAALVVLFRQRAQLQKDQCAFLSFVCLLPMLGGLLQTLLSGALFMWSFTAGALIVLYVYLQDQMIQIDGLTGVWTRRSFDTQIRQLSDGESCARGMWGVLFLDIDNFKQINDRFGHREGDAALKVFASAVRSALRRSDSVARLGGDEFAVLAQVDGEIGLRAVSQKITDALDAYNKTSRKPYRLTCSIGSELYESSCSVDSMMEKVDKLMYAQKRRNKAAAGS